jgi:hypothetical protein
MDLIHVPDLNPLEMFGFTIMFSGAATYVALKLYEEGSVVMANIVLFLYLFVILVMVGAL